jgi:hypothetical protein
MQTGGVATIREYYVSPLSLVWTQILSALQVCNEGEITCNENKDLKVLESRTQGIKLVVIVGPKQQTVTRRLLMQRETGFR